MPIYKKQPHWTGLVRRMKQNPNKSDYTDAALLADLGEVLSSLLLVP